MSVLEMNSRNVSELDLAKQTAENSADDEAGDEEDAKVKSSIRTRKRKKLASARGFFQLAETVEKAKWDDEAWRRDFNVINAYETRLETNLTIGASSYQIQRGEKGFGGCCWSRSGPRFTSN